jgi:hypothetical protein
MSNYSSNRTLHAPIYQPEKEQPPQPQQQAKLSAGKENKNQREFGVLVCHTTLPEEAW